MSKRKPEKIVVTWITKWICDQDDKSLPIKIHYPGVFWSEKEKQPFISNLDSEFLEYKVEDIQYLPYGVLTFIVRLNMDIDSIKDNYIFNDAKEYFEYCAKTIDDDGNYELEIDGNSFLVNAELYSMNWQQINTTQNKIT